MEREIWFRKVLWSYYPCSIKGWVFLFVMVVCVLCSVGVVSLLPIGEGAKDFLEIIVFASIFLFGLFVTRRHV